MQDSAYLVMNSNGIVAMKKNPPKLAGGQVAVKVEVEVTDTYFDTHVPVAKLNITDDMVIKPDIEVKVTDPYKEEDDL